MKCSLIFFNGWIKTAEMRISELDDLVKPPRIQNQEIRKENIRMVRRHGR